METPDESFLCSLETRLLGAMSAVSAFLAGSIYLLLN